MNRSNIFVCLLSFSLFLVAGDAAAFCVTAKQANLRAGPSTRSQKTWEVYQYMPLKRIGRKGAWYHVRDVDGDQHWIHGKLVSTKMHCAVVRKSTANVRSGPGLSHHQVSWSPVDHYYSFKVISQQGRWAKVKDQDGDIGWIAKSLLWMP